MTTSRLPSRPARHATAGALGRLPLPPLEMPWWAHGVPLPRAGWERLVEQQCGLTLRAQAHDAGLSDRQIHWRVQTGRWETVAPGLYLTTPGRADWGMWTVAAVLGSAQLAPPAPRRPGVLFGSAMLSHRAAATLQGLATPPAHPVIDITVPHRRRLTVPSGVLLHRSRFAVDRIDPVAWPWRTAVEHTVLDLAHVGALEEAVAVVAQALATRRVTPAGLAAALAGRPCQRWRRQVQDLLIPDAAGAESALEVRFVTGVLRPHGLPLGESQACTRAGRHDRLYAELRLLVELDGWTWHGTPGARSRDNRRDRLAGIDGWLTTRAGWREVVGTPCQLAWEMAALMQARGWCGAPRSCRRPACGPQLLQQ